MRRRGLRIALIVIPVLTIGAWLTPMAVGRAVAREATHRPSIKMELARAWKLLPRIVVPTHAHLATPRARAAIVGGTPATQGMFGFMALIEHFNSSGSPDFLCSGTVISPYVVMTAGHCTVDKATGRTLDPSGFLVVSGSVDWTNSAVRQASRVTGVQPDPSYNPAAFSSDAGLLTLATPTTAPAIRLATSADQPLQQGGTAALIAGWGATTAGGAAQTVLRWASTIVQAPSYCARFAATYDPAVQLCAVNSKTFNTATCNGDSGGPLVALDSSNTAVEIGATSYGPTNCNTSTADYFTTVAPLSSWANSIIGAATPPPPPPPPLTSPPANPTPQLSPAQAQTPTLPRMTRSNARTDARQTLARVFGRRFERGHGRRITCSGNTSMKALCIARFAYGPNDYWGTIAIFYEFGAGDKVYWSDRYTIHWVNAQCHLHSGHPRRCSIQTRRGTW